MIKKIIRPNIKKEFEKFGDNFKQIAHNAELNTYIYERISIDGTIHNGYEVIKAIKHKNPDGSIVYVYPQSKYWGIYGKTTHNLERAYELLNNGW